MKVRLNPTIAYGLGPLLMCEVGLERKFGATLARSDVHPEAAVGLGNDVRQRSADCVL